MALIQGTNGKCLCPVCLVPKDEQHDLGKTFRERTAAQSQAVVEHTMHLPHETAEKRLKKNGLRPIRVSQIYCFHSNNFFAQSTLIRMLSGRSTTRTLIVLCLSIPSILMTLASMVDTYGPH